MTPEELAVVREVIDILVSQVGRAMPSKVGPISFFPSPEGPMHCIVTVQRVRKDPDPNALFLIEERAFEVVLSARKVVRVMTKPPPR